MLKRLVLLLLCCLPATLVFADSPTTIDVISENPIPPRDPIDLALRLSGVEESLLDYSPRPDYAVGDSETFLIGGLDTEVALTRSFTLAAANEELYFWVEAGLSYDPASAQALAKVIAEEILPRLREVFGQERPIPSDDHIYILNVSALTPGVVGLYYDTDLYPDEVFASSNEIKSLFMARSLDSPAPYLSTVAHELQHMLQANQDESEETWITEGIAEVGSFMALPEAFGRGFQVAYIEHGAGLQLNSWSVEGNRPLHYGAASLFLSYMLQQYGEAAITALAQAAADGSAGIDAALQATGTDDRFADLFADFAIANYLNDPTVADGRFAHSLLGISDVSAPPTLSLNAAPLTLSDLQIAQHSTYYLELLAEDAQSLSLSFEGTPEVQLIPTQPHSGEHFYWSQRGNQGNTRLTGRFDLSAVESATFSFWTWYDIEEFWDYGYLSISTDGGRNWEVLTPPPSTDADPNSRAFAAGFTGRSSGATTESPAPYIGVEFDFLTMTVTAVLPDTPAASAGVLPGDQLIAINGIAFVPGEYIATIDQFQPGQPATLSFLRNGQPLDLEMTFTANPFRNRSQSNEWIQISVDLTPYVGEEILLRFDYVTDQSLSLPGWVLDDFAIPEIAFYDDSERENPAWLSEGWVRIPNTLPQDFLVQLIEFGEESTVTRLLEPGDGTSGEWLLNFEARGIPAQDRAVLAISPLAPLTNEAAQVELRLESRD